MILLFKKLFIFGVILYISGCAGFGTLYPIDTNKTVKPKIGNKLGSIYTSKDNIHSTCSQVLKLWGKPDNITIKGNSKTLTYKYGVIFIGIMPIIIIPIPLALPVGQKKTFIECENDKVTHAYKTYTGMSAAYCGILSAQPRFGCTTE